LPQKIPRQTPPLREVIRLIARLGGFLGRKGDGEPGAKRIRIGMNDLTVFVNGMHAIQDQDGRCA
jgi:hypothetical protein